MKFLLAPFVKIIKESPTLNKESDLSLQSWAEAVEYVMKKQQKALDCKTFKETFLFVRKNAVLIHQICLAYLRVASKNGVIDKIIDTEELKQEISIFK